MIEPEDISKDLRDTAHAIGFEDDPLGENLADCLNAMIIDPHTRAALVRELIANGHCSPVVWAVRTLGGRAELRSLHPDESEAVQEARRLHEETGDYYSSAHWTGDGE